MAEDKKMYRVVEFPLIVDQATADNIDKRIEVARSLYNEMNGHYQKRLRALTLSKEWFNLQKEIKREVKALNGNSDDSDETDDKKKKRKSSPALKALFDKRSAMIRQAGFSEFDFISAFNSVGKKYQKSFGTSVSSTLASQLFGAYEKLFYGSGEQISFKKAEEFNSIASNNKTSIRFLYDDKGKYIKGSSGHCVVFSNKVAKVKPFIIRVKVPKSDYTDFMLRQFEKNGAKVCRVLRRQEKSKGFHYYVQISIPCDSVFDKLGADGESYHSYAVGQKVTLNLYNDKLVAFSEKCGTRVYELTEGYAAHQAVIEELSQRMDVLRRQLNPDNFDDEGKIKHGIIGEDGVRRRLRWVSNLEYRQLKNALREEHRKFDVTKKLRLRRISYDILSMGTDITVYDCNIEKKKEKPDYAGMMESGEGLPPQKYLKKKKRERRSIQQGAPSTLFAYVNGKLSDLKQDELKKVRVPEEIFYYDLATDRDNEQAFKDGVIAYGGRKYNCLLYRAVLLFFYDNGEIDKKKFAKALKGLDCELKLSDV